MGRNYDHVVDVPFWDYMIRILQAILALALVILTIYTLVFNDFPAVRLSLFTSLWDTVILAYYLIAVHALPFIYNWAAVIVTELLVVVFWAATFSSLAALYTDHKYSGLLYENVIIATIALAAFAFVLHVITFGMIANGVRKHRGQGKPLFSPQGKGAQTAHEPETQHV